MDHPESKKKVPYYRKPEGMSVDQWQTELRKQFALKQKFRIRNTGYHPVYSDFEVFNPETGKTYKVSIRDNIKSFNFCSCPDFTINALGTCKHIEYIKTSLFTVFAKKVKRFISNVLGLNNQKA